MTTTTELLDFEQAWTDRTGTHLSNGHKEEAIRTQLNLTPARYFQLLGRVIWTTEALDHNPTLTKRLRRIQQDNADEQARRLSIR